MTRWSMVFVLLVGAYMCVGFTPTPPTPMPTSTASQDSDWTPRYELSICSERSHSGSYMVVECRPGDEIKEREYPSEGRFWEGSFSCPFPNHGRNHNDLPSRFVR